jgi:hypothetical protein
LQGIESITGRIPTGFASVKRVLSTGFAIFLREPQKGIGKCAGGR